jgi:hypothetical protein
LASVAKNHSAHLVTQAFDFFGVCGAPEALGKFEKLLLLALLRLHAVLDEFQKHPIGAKPACFCQTANLCGDAGRQADALPHQSDCSPHYTIMHQKGAGGESGEDEAHLGSHNPVFGASTRRQH